jgi:hypothetical protein
MRKAQNFYLENLNGTDHLGDQAEDWRKITTG